MISEWSLEGYEGLRQVRKHTRVETPHPEEFYVRGVTVPMATVTVSRVTLSPHRQVGTGCITTEYASMCVVLSGAVTLRTDSGPEHLHRGQVYSPHRTPGDWLDVATPAQLVIVNPRQVAPDRQPPPAERNGFDSWHMAEPSLLLFESLCDWLCAASPEAPTDSIDAAGTTLLTLLGHPDNTGGQELRGSAPSAVYEEAMRIVDAEFRDPHLNAPSLAKRLRVSLRTLHRAFESRAMSISKEIRRRRIEHAEILLRNPRYSSMPVSEIARISGAPSIAYLRMAIKEKHDVSPTQLREMSMVGVPSA
ncbi:AraC family transcriptional regulator [Rhodococcus sp. ACT016]|uniref:AraC family transcriptional regulator n=1 Tax=Rhodococcus sp. ACT016 TaxID=3134808 RepID=UPI003D296DCD